MALPHWTEHRRPDTLQGHLQWVVPGSNARPPASMRLRRVERRPQVPTWPNGGSESGRIWRRAVAPIAIVLPAAPTHTGSSGAVEALAFRQHGTRTRARLALSWAATRSCPDAGVGDASAGTPFGTSWSPVPTAAGRQGCASALLVARAVAAAGPRLAVPRGTPWRSRWASAATATTPATEVGCRTGGPAPSRRWSDPQAREGRRIAPRCMGLLAMDPQVSCLDIRECAARGRMHG